MFQNYYKCSWKAILDDSKGKYGFTQSQVCLKNLSEVDKF